jgi:hypothetical protein
MTRIIVALGIAFLCCTSITLGQQDSTWGRWDWLLGDWVGEASGKPGEGTGSFSLLPDLDGRVLIRRSHAEYPASKEKPQVIHDDLMIVYVGPAGQPDRAIYFDNEGHVINYSIAYAGASIVFTSDAMKSVPVFRLTYARLDQGGIHVAFAISRDGREFVTYTEGNCRRAKSGG